MHNYRIKSGDTLSEIAQRYKTTVSALARANKIANPNLIYAGRSLRIPGHSGADSFEPAGQRRASGRRSGAARQPAPAPRSGGSSRSGGAQRGQRAERSERSERSERASNSGGGVTDTMRRLAAAGRSAALSIGGYTSRGLCATGVSKAILNARGFKVWGNGNQIDNNLPRSKFKQVHMSLAEALKTPGLVLTWERTSTSLGRIYGHTAITAGDGRTSYSDFIESNTLAGSGGRSGLKIFRPI